MTSVRFHPGVSVLLLLFLFIPLAAKDHAKNSCNHCANKRSGKNDAAGARLISGCNAKTRIGSLSPEEAERYCKWVVRLRREPEPTATTETNYSDREKIEAAIHPLKLVQPPQVEGDFAGVLVAHPNGTPGDFEIVWLRRNADVWTIDRTADSFAERRQSGGNRH